MKFNEFVKIREAEEETAPAGVDPELWNNPSYKRFWQAQNNKQAPFQKPTDPVTAAVQNKMNEIENIQKQGGAVPPFIVNALGLNRATGYVANGLLYASTSMPFWRGNNSQSIYFNQRFPLTQFKSMFDKLIDQALRRDIKSNPRKYGIT